MGREKIYGTLWLGRSRGQQGVNIQGLMFGAILMPARWNVAAIALKSGYLFL
jgi:hypothetical protein